MAICGETFEVVFGKHVQVNKSRRRTTKAMTSWYTYLSGV